MVEFNQTFKDLRDNTFLESLILFTDVDKSELELITRKQIQAIRKLISLTNQSISESKRLLIESPIRFSVEPERMIRILADIYGEGLDYDLPYYEYEDDIVLNHIVQNLPPLDVNRCDKFIATIDNTEAYSLLRLLTETCCCQEVLDAWLKHAIQRGVSEAFSILINAGADWKKHVKAMHDEVDGIKIDKHYSLEIQEFMLKHNIWTSTNEKDVVQAVIKLTQLKYDMSLPQRLSNIDEDDVKALKMTLHAYFATSNITPMKYISRKKTPDFHKPVALKFMSQGIL